MSGTKGHSGRPAKLTALERKERAKECQKKWRAKNRERLNEYSRKRYAEAHTIRRKRYETDEQRRTARHEYYRNNPERIMRQRLTSAINLLNRFGYINDTDAERMRGQV